MEQNFRRIGTIIWAALVAGVLAFFAVSLYLFLFGHMPGDARLVPVMLPVAGGLSVVNAALSWLWAVRMRPAVRAGAAPPSPEAFALTRLIVASALCEGAALSAIVGFLTTQDAVLLLPLALSFAALVAHFPGARHWARLVGEPAASARPNRMIRG